MNHKKLSLFLIGLILLGMSQIAVAQKTDSQKKDSATVKQKLSYVAKMMEFARVSAVSSKADFNADKAAIQQNRLFEEIKITMRKAKSYLKSSLDTVGIAKELASIQKNFETAGDGVLTEKGTAQTFRNLTASSKVLSELLNQANLRKAQLDLHQQELNDFRYQLDSLLSVPSLFLFPTDSTILSAYIQKIKVVAYEINPIDSALKQNALTTQELLNRVNMEVFNLQSSLEEIERYQKGLAHHIFRREFDNIFGRVGYYRPFNEIISQAKAKGLLTIVFYLQNNSIKLLMLVLLVIGSFIYLRSLKRIYVENKLITPDFEGQLVLRYPLASALLITLNLFQFLFFSPPFILNVILWSIGCVSLTILFRKFVAPYWMGVWLLMVILFEFAAFDNLILQASRTERWCMLVLSALGVFSGLYILLKGKKEELREKLILIAIGFMVVLELFSCVSNIFGRYNLAKSLLISGYLNVVVAILFLWTVRLINEGLYLAFNVYTHQEPKLFYLNFDKVGKKVPVFFYVLLVFGWMILFGRNFAGFDYISGPLRVFFGQERTLGDYTFSINSLLLFIVIMSISVVVSKIVSFFASDKHLSGKDENSKSKGIGSWLLLVRISILSIGLFLAIAAAGIPLDRITIVLGALGVGIGFGLQALVNNLVSGLIIAFEKPVNVGDVVDVDGQSGTVKSIGFRSSVIATWEGGDVVLPNGDLLNSHLTNWTLAGNRKRLSIVLGIAYDADLDAAKQMVQTILDEEPRLMKNPVPVVQYDQFNDSAINMKILFWPKTLREAFEVKSDLIIRINAQFKQKNISIPFPQHEVRIRHMEGLDPNNSKQ